MKLNASKQGTVVCWRRNKHPRRTNYDQRQHATVSNNRFKLVAYVSVENKNTSPVARGWESLNWNYWLYRPLATVFDPQTGTVSPLKTHTDKSIHQSIRDKKQNGIVLIKYLSLLAWFLSFCCVTYGNVRYCNVSQGNIVAMQLLRLKNENVLKTILNPESSYLSL